MMLAVFALTLFLSATLLFLIEPMVGKMATPLLGGTPAVWNTCMVFFQIALLAGYAYAHATSGWLGVRRQAWLQLLILATPFLLFLVFPLTLDKNLIAGSEQNPIPTLLLVLTLSVGLPFFVVSTSAPLLQNWFADTDHPAARDPYFLYGASNLGSMLTLLSYPVLVEPHLTLNAQRYTWIAGYAVLVLLTAACAVLLWKSAPAVAADEAPTKEAPAARSEAIKTPPRVTALRNRGKGRTRSEKVTTRPASVEPGAMGVVDTPLGGEVTWVRRLRWVVLAAVPSSLMLGVTTYMTTDIAAIPLLWVLPLAVYLLTFIIVFSNVPEILHKGMVLLLPLTVLFLLFIMLAEVKLLNLGMTIALHLFTLFVVAMVCHGELARDRPAPKHLTEFFLWMSVGGVVGGLFNALVAPVVFNGIVEYQLAMVLACLLTPGLNAGKESGWGLYADLALVGIFIVTGALLIWLRVADGDINWSALAEARWGWPLAGLLVLVAAGLVNVLRTRDRPAQLWLDLALPLALAVLVVGLVWGIYSDPVWKRLVSAAKLVHLKPAQFYVILAYGLPAVFCYTFVERPLRFGLGVAAMLLASGFSNLTDESVVYQTRSFFGVLKVEEDRHFRRLVHGTTMHGKQFLDPDLRGEPLTYYHRTGPIGRVMAAYSPNGERNLAVIGLGTGTMAAYARPGQSITFYDIDPAVRDISFTTDKYFTYVSDARARGARVQPLVLGDARLTMERQQLSEADKYGVIVVDAFSSDAIPIHLITWEALQIYLDKMTEDGILAFHVSNRYLDLRPVLANQAEKAGLACLYQSDDDEDYPGKARSTWVMLARKEEYLSRLIAPANFEKERAEAVAALSPLMHLPDSGTGLSAHAMMLTGVLTTWTGPGEWKKPATKPEVGVWTDDYSNLFSVFSW
jgi:spermidine synthase